MCFPPKSAYHGKRAQCMQHTQVQRHSHAQRINILETLGLCFEDVLPSRTTFENLYELGSGS